MTAAFSRHCRWLVGTAKATTLLMGLSLLAQAGEALRPPRAVAGDTDEVTFVVRVEPVNIGARPFDHMPAEIPVDLSELVGTAAKDRRLDVGSITVVRVTETGDTELSSPGFAHSTRPNARPFAWYDDAVPYAFGEVSEPPHLTTGARKRAKRVRGGFAYPVLGEWKRGRIAWTHTQEGMAPSFYRMSFRLLSLGELPREIPSEGWMANGVPRADKNPATTTGAAHTRLAVTDWNGDGLSDILYGESYGHLFVMLNSGTPESPRFRAQQMVMESDGQPLDCGMASAPLVTDWDGDGVEDLLVGAHWNRTLFFKNVGSNTRREFVYRGLVEADGKPLELPVSPVIGRPEGIFVRDYYPVLETVDWNGDGRLDLLAGGYVTGRIYYFENVGAGSGGIPRLTLRGALEADGVPINAQDWAAAPAVADFNGDGRPDLVVGGYPMTPESKQSGAFLQYFENGGERGQPRLTRKPFPGTGGVPLERMASPRAVDWNRDGRLDLILSAGSEIYLFGNVGTRTAPQFALHQNPIRLPSGNDPLPAQYFLDWNQDGLPDAVSGYSVWLNTGQPNPYRFGERIEVVAEKDRIDHRSGIGDDWFWIRFCDFERSGKLDILAGDWHGHIWLHQKLAGDPGHFDRKGAKLMTTTGEPIKVGPVGNDPAQRFRALQGARTVFTAADYNHDGLTDLVVGDTYGLVRYYENRGQRGKPVFAPAQLIGDLGQRLNVATTDWNQDGHPDVIAGSADGKVRVFLNHGGRAEQPFAEGFDPNFPAIEQPQPVPVDLDGDGDDDFFIRGTQGSILVDRSFLNHGYPSATIVPQPAQAR